MDVMAQCAKGRYLSVVASMQEVAVSADRPTPSVRIVIIDAQPIFRAGLVTTLGVDGIAVVGQAADDAEMTCLVTAGEFDVAIVGGAPAEELTAVRRVRAIRPGCGLLALANELDALRAAELLRCGATGCAPRSQDPAALLEAIKRVGAGQRYLPPGVLAAEVDELLASRTPWGLERLTPRESEIFELLAQGYTNDSIASRLGIACRTVETHRRHLMQKLGARSIVDLLRMAARHRLLH
jgi:DNA-binding NarL/FixJ family response regulator